MGRRPKIKIKPAINEQPELETEKEQNQESETNSDSNVGESISGTDSNDQFENDLAEIDKIIAEEKTEKRGRKTKEEKQKAALIIPGSLFVRVHNYVGTSAISLLDSYITKQNPVPSELLSMDEKLIMELAPLAELAMKQMKIEENPIAAFYVSFGSIMVSNYMSVKTLIKQAMKENPKFDINELIKNKK